MWAAAGCEHCSAVGNICRLTGYHHGFCRNRDGSLTRVVAVEIAQESAGKREPEGSVNLTAAPPYSLTVTV